MVALDMLDFYHPPHPTLPPASANFKVLGTDRKLPKRPGDNSNYIDQLPVEIRDEIFALLPLPALEAARDVCPTWRNRISSSSWIMRTSLQRAAPLATKLDADPSKLISQLKRQLQIEQRLQAEMWKARYIMNSVYFSFPEQSILANSYHQRPPSTLATCPDIVECIPFGNLVAFTICNGSRVTEAIRPRYIVMIFHIFQSGQPTMVAAAACPPERGAPSKVAIREVPAKRPLTWIVEVSFPALCPTSSTDPSDEGSHPEKRRKHSILDDVGFLLLVQRPAFGKEESPFENPGEFKFGNAQSEREGGLFGAAPQNVGALQTHGSHHSLESGSPAVISPWTLLYPLPNDWGDDPICFIARHDCTEELFLVRITRPDRTNPCKEPICRHDTPDFPTYLVSPMALISRPYGCSAYINLASAPRSRVESNSTQLTGRVAIIWKQPNSTLSVLFLYDVYPKGPSHTYTEKQPRTADPIVQLEKRRSDMFSIEANPSLLDSGANANIIPACEPCHWEFTGPTIQGKRICSLAPGLGGLHWSVREEISTIFAKDRYDLGKQALVGGLQIPEDGHRKCVVWGPTIISESGSVGFKVLSFNFARDFFWFDHMCWRQASANGYQHFARGLLGNCCCYLHDREYHVTVTDNVAPTESDGISQIAKYSLLALSWSSKAKSSLVNENDVGVNIMLVESAAQREALERYERESSAFERKVDEENAEHAKHVRENVPFRFRTTLNDPADPQPSWRRFWG